MAVDETIAARLERVRERISAAAARSGRRADEITLVGASKTVDVERIAAAVAAGLRDLGENYVQEAETKIGRVLAALSEAGSPVAVPRWHLIGHLQTNKARAALELFDIIQTLDSERLAAALARHATSPPRVPVLLEIDFTGLPERTGLAPEAAPAVVERILVSESLAIQGLMTVPAMGLSEADTRAVYRGLVALRDDLAGRYPAEGWVQLSMGMTDDFELAIEEGATIVRIGRAIFGERP
jgi:PLP dependent protein